MTKHATTPAKLGLAGLVAIVFGPMIGSGIFNIAQNMADGASVGAVIISWLITAVGILFLVYTFKVLSDCRPDLTAGIYEYAQVGFGNYVGFNIAWGYWLCTAFGNVAYIVMLNDSVGAFFPSLLEHGWHTVVFTSVLIWLMFLLVRNGLRTAAFLNTAITCIKFLSLILIVAVLIICFKVGMFTSDFWGHGLQIGNLGTQIKSTMMVTLWCFIGIEGAMMMSARAKRHSDVGKAGVLGFLAAWLLYTLVSVLCFGVMQQPELAQLQDPSVAYVLKFLCGDWAYYFVVVSIIVSLSGGWVGWTLICAQVPMEAARVGILPRRFMKLNSHQMPTYGLLVSCIAMQLFIGLVVTADEVYLAALNMTSMMVLPCYLFCGLFLLKASYNPQRFLHRNSQQKTRTYRVIGLICSVYCLWLIYAGGPRLLLTTSVFYLAGFVYYYRSCKQYGRHLFTHAERWLFVAICLASVVSLYLIFTGDAM